MSTGHDSEEEDKKKKKKKAAKPKRSGDEKEMAEGDDDQEQEQEDDDEEADMIASMGFGGFGTTKGTQVVDNAFGAAAGGVSKHGSRKYRQYMNRRGG